MTIETEAAPVLPLFYGDPVPLSSARHGALRLLSGDAGFARRATALPLMLTDFAAASHHYPILFTSGEVAPVALVGLEHDNLFIEDGRWAQGAYVPAYVRRYPFVLIEAADKSGFSLAVDRASDLIANGGEAGEPLFVDTEPSEVTKRALEFCRLFNIDYEVSRAFCAALAEENLLIERQADVTLPDGRKLGVGGFQVVDPERFTQLSEEKLVAWHRNGWLAAIHAHLASLYRFADLLTRQTKRISSQPADAVPAPSSGDGKNSSSKQHEEA